jgi:hypothetical protein
MGSHCTVEEGQFDAEHIDELGFDALDIRKIRPLLARESDASGARVGG